MDFKMDGFKGQRSISLGYSLREQLRNSTLHAGIYVTDVGYYPLARRHYRSRDSGTQENILIYCIDGRGWVEFDGLRHTVRANEFFIIPQGAPHAYGAETISPWSIYWLHFCGIGSDIATGLSGRAVRIMPTRDISPVRVQLFEDIYQNLDREQSPECMEYVGVVALHLLASFRYPEQFGKVHVVKNRNVMHDAIIFMKENLDRPLKLEDIAGHINCSASHFSALFKQNRACTPMEYFNQLRVQQAAQHLEYSDISIKDIAFRYGFDDSLYFSKVFKKFFGKSPIRYRAECRQPTASRRDG